MQNQKPFRVWSCQKCGSERGHDVRVSSFVWQEFATARHVAGASKWLLGGDSEPLGVAHSAPVLGEMPHIELERVCGNCGATEAFSIAADPKTGEIRESVSDRETAAHLAANVIRDHAAEIIEWVDKLPAK